MKTLITGISGFTGRHLEKRLLALGCGSVDGLRSDICNYESLCKEIEEKNPEIVVHLAAISHVQNQNTRSFYDVNLIGSLNLLQAIYNYAPKIKSVLLASSAYVYGETEEKFPIEENSALNGINDYSVSKISMEMMGKLWMDRLPIIISRPFNYTGLGQSQNFIIPKIVDCFKKRASQLMLGNLSAVREFNDVDDVVSLYSDLVLQSSPPVGKVINICSGMGYNLNHVIEMCAKLTGHSLEVVLRNEFIRKNEINYLVGDANLLKKVVGRSLKGDLEKTLSSMLRNSGF